MTATVDADRHPGSRPEPAKPYLSRRRRRRNVQLLAAAAVLFGVLQLVFMGLDYGYGWDEAVYLSMANPHVPDFYWSAVRAWGVPVLAAPVAAFNAPLEITRLYFIALSSVALYLAFRPWLAIRNTVAVPLAALLFATTFVTVYYGPQAMPNLYVAFGSVAAAAFFVLSRSGRGTVWTLVGLGATVGLVALVRPSDSLWLIVPLGVAWLVARGWRRPGVLAAIALGEIVGWLPWMADAYLRFGGPLNRLREGEIQVGGGGLHLDLSTAQLYARMSGGGPLMCYCADRPWLAGRLHPVVLAWLVVAAALVVLAIAVARRSGRLMATALPTAAAVSLAFSYLFILDYAASRFLLPAVALIALPVAEGLVSVTRLPRRNARRIAVTLVVVIVAGHVGLQSLVLHRRMPWDSAAHHVPVAIANRLEALGIRQPCMVVGQSTPPVAYRLGCDSEAHGPKVTFSGELPAVSRARAGGQAVAVITRSAPPADSYLRRWRLFWLDPATRVGWRIYLPPDQPVPAGAHR